MQVIIMDDVRRLVMRLEKPLKGRVYEHIRILEDFGHILRMPYSRNILPSVFELRVSGRVDIRLIYVFRADAAVIFHVFIKKTSEISSLEMHRIRLKLDRLQI